MASIPAPLRRLVRRRASYRCEYCRLAQVGQEATFHLDHIAPEADGGASVAANLALACVSCSLRKGPRQSAVAVQTGKRVALFHPRRDRWSEHFRWDGLVLVGITAKGRATIDLLKLNRPSILAIREQEALRGRHPASEENEPS
jgi:HNH endonuclease